jgi:hypothetical protein
MKRFFLIIIGVLLLVGIYQLLSVSGSDDLKFRNLDKTIFSDLDILKNEYLNGKLNAHQYLEKLKSLSKKEDDLFDEVKLHKFEDIKEYNYWHRGRLKFPSNIKMEIFRITKTEEDPL